MNLTYNYYIIKIYRLIDISRSGRPIVTWIRFLRVPDQAILAQAASEFRIALHGEHAEDRHVLVLLLRPSDPLFAHRFRLQVQLARQPLAQRVGSHAFFLSRNWISLFSPFFLSHGPAKMCSHHHRGTRARVCRQPPRRDLRETRTPKRNSRRVPLTRRSAANATGFDQIISWSRLFQEM